MDIHVRNFVLYKMRTIDQQQKELNMLKRRREEMRQDVIDASNRGEDGMPRAKGSTSDTTLNKVIKFEAIDRRIKRLEDDLRVIQKAREKIYAKGYVAKKVFDETIAREVNLEYKSLDYGVGRTTLWRYRTKLLEEIAEDLGEYAKDDWEENK